MWRSFFYAVGIGLFSLGLQSLVLDHVLVPKNTRLQKMIKRILEEEKPASRGLNTAQAPQPNNAFVSQRSQPWANQAQQPQNQARGLFGGVDTGSRFGPSRFAGPAYGTGYGGGRINAGSQYGSSQAQFQNGTARNAQLASFRNNLSQQPPAAKKGATLQKMLVREWMPWSLLASGAIIFLYTHTIHKRRSHD